MFFNEKADWNEIVPEINCPGTRSSSVMWYTVVCSGTWLSISRVGNFSTCSFHGRLHQEKEGRKLKVIGPDYSLPWVMVGQVIFQKVTLIKDIKGIG